MKASLEKQSESSLQRLERTAKHLMYYTDSRKEVAETMTFSFLFFTITIQKRKHSKCSQAELEALIHDEKIEKQLEAIKTRYWYRL